MSVSPQIHAIGALPFVGRREEIARLTAFWNRSREADGIYLGLMIGEAGIGKSRLLAELLPAIERLGGAVVHAKLYPHSSSDVEELIGRAIGGAGIWRQSPASGTEDGSVDRLRRLSRLRRTLLVIEDIHLLDGERMLDLESLLQTLADDPIGVLCVARSIEMKGSGLLESHLVETIHLKGLEPVDLSDLWKRLFGVDGKREVIENLHEATGGNGLALRSTLRAAIDSGAIAVDDDGNISAGPMFGALVRHKVGRIAEGLMLHLTPGEQKAASELAFLGEVFSREAAQELMSGADTMLERLIEGQVVMTIEQPVMALHGTLDWTQPLDKYIDPYTPTSRFPLLSFTHTLLHRHLLEHGSPSWDRLAYVLARDMPIYSLIPLEYPEELCNAPDLGIDDLRRLLYRTCAIALDLGDRGSDEEAIRIIDVAEKIGHVLTGMSEPDRCLVEAELLHVRLWVSRRIVDDGYQEMLDRMGRLTRDPASPAMASYRFAWYDCRLNREPFGQIFADARADVEPLLERFPELALQDEYIIYLRIGFRHAIQYDQKAAREIERRLNEFAARPGAAERYEVDIFLFRVLLVSLYDSPEELAMRWQQLEQLRRSPSDNSGRIEAMTCQLLNATGWLDRMLVESEAFARQLRGELAPYRLLNIRSMQLVARAGFEPDRHRIDEAARQVREEFQPVEHQVSTLVTISLVVAGLFRGDVAWVRETLDRPDAAEGIPALYLLQCRVLMLDTESVRSTLDAYPAIVQPAVASLLRSMIDVLDGSAEADTVLGHVARYFEREIVKLTELAYLHALFALVDRCRERSIDGELVERLKPHLSSALERWLEWLAERSLFTIIRLLTDRCGAYLPGPRLERWRSRADMLEHEWLARQSGEGDGRIAISMLDTIGIARDGTDTERVRGARMKILLGLMVADRMIGTPLSHTAFRELIAGEEGDVEHPRKVLNLTVFRLRELIGNDAILTDDETPRLNLDRVRVDLLDADELVRRGARHLRDGDLARAVPVIVEALEIIGTGTPFPSLYDRFFEAMREDFENRLRSVVIDAARSALLAEDASSVEPLLSRAVRTLPGDEEIIGLLKEALTAQNRSAEAMQYELRQE